MTCPNCSRAAPLCPVCGAPMLNNDRTTHPAMDRPCRVISHKWSCSDGDGKGTRHYVELEAPHREG